VSGTYVSQSPTYGRTFLASVIAALSARPAGALLTNGKLRLSKDPGFNPTENSHIADLTGGECDFSGYTAGGYTVTLGATLNVSGSALGAPDDILAVATTATPQVGNSIYGYWIDDGTNIVMFEVFAGGPIPVAIAGDYCEVDLRVPLRFNQPVQ
jgi:hypothetical protein